MGDDNCIAHKVYRYRTILILSCDIVRYIDSYQWTVATYHTGLLLHSTLDCGSPFGIIFQYIVTYLAYLAILRTIFSQFFHINVRQNTLQKVAHICVYMSHIVHIWTYCYISAQVVNVLPIGTYLCILALYWYILMVY